MFSPPLAQDRSDAPSHRVTIAVPARSRSRLPCSRSVSPAGAPACHRPVAVMLVSIVEDLRHSLTLAAVTVAASGMVSGIGQHSMALRSRISHEPRSVGLWAGIPALVGLRVQKEASIKRPAPQSIWSARCQFRRAAYGVQVLSRRRLRCALQRRYSCSAVLLANCAAPRALAGDPFLKRCRS